MPGGRIALRPGGAARVERATHGSRHRSKRAITRTRGIDAPATTRRDDLERLSHQRLLSFIAHHVYMPAAGVDEPGSCRVPGRRAGWIVAVINRCRSRLDQHHTGTRVGMPAAVAAYRNGADDQIDIRWLFRDDPNLRVVALGTCPAEDSNLLEERSHKVTCEILGWCCQRGAGPTQHGRCNADGDPSGCRKQPASSRGAHVDLLEQEARRGPGFLACSYAFKCNRCAARP